MPRPPRHVPFPADADEYRLLMESWARSLRARGRSPATVHNYLTTLRLFAAWLSAAGLPLDPAQLRREHIEAWLVALRDTPTVATGAPARGTTIVNRYLGLHAWFAWLAAQDELPANPMARIPVPQAQAPRTPLYSDAELKRLLATCEKLKTFEGKRDLALLRLLLDTGLRVGEAAALTLADVDLDRALVVVRHGKGDVFGVVPISSPKALAAIDSYHRARRKQKHAALAEFWIGRKGAIAAKGLYDIVTSRGRQAELPDLHPHSLRHQFAHMQLAAGMTEGDLMRLTRHKNIATLRRYGAALADERAAQSARNLKATDRI